MGLVASVAVGANVVPRDAAVRHITLSPSSGLKAIEGGFESEVISPGIAWTEVVPSWSCKGTEKGGNIEVSVRLDDQPFRFGKWSLHSAPELRTSVNDQKSEAGVVYTDTLVATRPGRNISVHVRVFPSPNGDLPQLDWVRLSFSAGIPAPSSQIPAAINPLNVPIRAQGDYPGGNVLCSPTSVSMVLSYWAKELNHAELDADVPEVQSGVFDPAWGGTGNWTFNAAFAASRPGLTATVARLRDIDDLTAWLRAGVPVVTSVSYDFLKGKDKRGENDGHLVIVVGIDENGDFVFNDPGRKPIRLTYKREDFVRAWAASRNTVYLVHPERWIVPKLP